jgi:Clr5 domain
MTPQNGVHPLDWERYKNRMKELYILKDMKLAEMMREMELSYGFVATYGPYSSFLRRESDPKFPQQISVRQNASYMGIWEEHIQSQMEANRTSGQEAQVGRQGKQRLPQ